jgi:hypothetical protein
MRACLAQIANVLTGYEIETVSKAGWAGLKNGGGSLRGVLIPATRDL